MSPKRGGYTSIQISKSVIAPRVAETPDTDASRIYMQRWKRQDGKMRRMFNVLALDTANALVLGAIRLSEKYKHDPIDWVNETNTPLERHQSVVVGILTIEGKEERGAREAEWFKRRGGNGK